jgi:hypothetical protein
MDGELLMTVAPDAVSVCNACPDVHIRVLEVATPENIRVLAAGLLHLAGHAAEKKS